MGHGGFNRPSIFSGAAASGHELRIDLAYRHTPLVGFDRIRQLKQPALGGLGRRERAIFLEFYFPRFRSYQASAAALASAFRKAVMISSSVRPTRIRAHATLNLALQS